MTIRTLLLASIDAAYDRRSWHGTNLRGSLRAGQPFNFEGLVRGVAAHDLYHAGQIQLLKRLQH